MSDPDMFQFMLNLTLYLFHTAEIAYHDMGSQCCFGSAQCPDMQMVITLHTGLLQDNPPDLFTIYSHRDSVERKAEAVVQ